MTPIEILYQDTDCAVVVKPVGVASASAPGKDLPSLAAATLGIEELFPVHRLDQGVGGVCLLAKTKQATAHFTALMQNGGFQKQYLAILCGIPTKQADTLTDLLYHDKRANKSYVVARKRAGVKDASLSYRVCSMAETPLPRTLVSVTLHTGRTHQIRVQFSSRGLPLLGDRKYGGAPSSDGIALFAHRLTLPIHGKPVTFTATPPECFDF